MGTHPIFESDFDCLTECCLDSPPDQPAPWSPPQSRSTVSLVHTLLQPILPPSPLDKRKPSLLTWLCCQPFSKKTPLSHISQIHLSPRVINLLPFNPLLAKLVSLTPL